MAPERDERELERLFGALRATEALRVPARSFAALWARAATLAAARRRRRRALRFAAAGALAAAAVVTLVVVRRPGPPPVDVAHWRSPTASLLHGPGDALLREVPRLATSVVSPAGLTHLPGGNP